MRLSWFAAALAISAGPALRGEIHDVLKSAEIEAGFAQLKGSSTVHQRPNYSISLHSQEGRGGLETHDGADEVLFIRSGSGSLLLDNRKFEIGAGDVINVRRKTSRRIEATGRIEYVAIRVFPTGENGAASGIRPAPRVMPDVLRAAAIDETFVRFDTNQPIHSAPNFTLNYVIYNGRVGPWETHHGCVDIYFMRIGTAAAQLGGSIRDAKEESPGEIRGSGVTDARRREIGPGDIVLIPRNTAHHMDPGAGKLGYLLMKIWVE